MVAGIVLCNSACIACIWCFLLSICCPKFAKMMEETESWDYIPRKYESDRESFDSLRERESRKRNSEKRAYCLIREQSDPGRARRHQDPANDYSRKPKDFPSQDQVFFLQRPDGSNESNLLFDRNYGDLNYEKDYHGFDRTSKKFERRVDERTMRMKNENYPVRSQKM